MHPPRDLIARGFTGDWFRSAGPEVELTVLLARSRLSEHGLWRFVVADAETTVGRFQFACEDVAGLKAALIRAGFTRPADGDGRWESREVRVRAALHLKHFDGWPPDRIQAHIDPWGLAVPAAFWLTVLGPPVVALLHALSPDGYRNVDRIRRILLCQGCPEADLQLHGGASDTLHSRGSTGRAPWES